MSATNDFDRLARAWLADGPSELSDRVLSAALGEVHLTTQRRRFALLRRDLVMHRLVLIALALLIGTAAIAGGAYLLSTRPSISVPTPAPSAALGSPSPGASTSPNPVDTSGWLPQTSTRFGISFALPPGWTFTAASQPWVYGQPDPMEFNIPPYVDEANDPAAALTITIASEQLPPSMTDVEWLGQLRGENTQTPCSTPVVQLPRTTVDAHPAWLFLPDNCPYLQAVVFAGGRVYELRGNVVPDLGFHGTFDEALFRAWLTTVHLDPASADDRGAVVASPTSATTPDIVQGRWKSPSGQILVIGSQTWTTGTYSGTVFADNEELTFSSSAAMGCGGGSVAADASATYHWSASYGVLILTGGVGDPCPWRQQLFYQGDFTRVDVPSPS